MSNYTCPNCGNPVSEYDRICPNCGATIDQNLARYGNQSQALRPKDTRDNTNTNAKIPFDKPDLQQDPHSDSYHNQLSTGRVIWVGLIVIVVLGFLILRMLN